MKITDDFQFKIGMKIRILKRPSLWNDNVNNNYKKYPLNLQYPLEITIQDIGPSNDEFFNITDGTYGWYSRSLIQAGCEIVEDSSSYNRNPPTVSRFPFHLKWEDLRKLVTCVPSCTYVKYAWKDILIDRWINSLPYTEFTIIDQKLYEEMRKDCHPNVNHYLDEIFGPDIVLPNYKKGDLLFVSNGSSWYLRYFSHFDMKGKVCVYDAQKKEGCTKSVLKHKLAGFELPD